jgi:hypothetical protein
MFFAWITLNGQGLRHGMLPWMGYISSYPFGGKFAVWNDAHWVDGIFFLGRHGLSWFPGSHIGLTGGYAWLFTGAGKFPALERFEHRPWGQVTWSANLRGGHALHLRYRQDWRIRQRLESGIPQSDFVNNQRLRFMAGIRRPLKGNTLEGRTPFLVLGNEIIFNAGPATGFGLDQNRTWLLFGVASGPVTFQYGYMARFVPGKQDRLFHHITLWVSHTLRKKETVPAEIQEELLHREP